MAEHGLSQKHSCEFCGKHFHLKWRLRKHMQNHELGYDVPRCHYYRNQKECPYVKVGCMYKHEKSGKCKAIICTRQMCQFEHEEKMTVEEQVERSIHETK